MQIMLTLALVGQAVDEPRIGVEVEDTGFVFSKDGAVFVV